MWCRCPCMMRFVQSYARAHTHAYPHTRIRMRTHTRILFKQTEHRRGGVSLQTLSSEERLRRAPFLTVLGTHCISRSFPLPPQRMPASPASASEAPGPVPHAHPATSKRPRNQTPHVHAARCVGVPAFAMWPASHAGRGDTLEGLCCLTLRRHLARYRLRDREAVPQRQAVPIVAPSTRAPPGITVSRSREAVPRR